MMQAELKRLHSPDVTDLNAFRPNGPFGFLLQAMVGPQGADGEEAFDVVVCTPEWLGSHMNGPIQPGRHFLLVRDYSYEAVEYYLRAFCVSCQGNTWPEVARRVGRIGKWEFEDYTEQPAA